MTSSAPSTPANLETFDASDWLALKAAGSLIARELKLSQGQIEPALIDAMKAGKVTIRHFTQAFDTSALGHHDDDSSDIRYSGPIDLKATRRLPMKIDETDIEVGTGDSRSRLMNAQLNHDELLDYIAARKSQRTVKPRSKAGRKPVHDVSVLEVLLRRAWPACKRKDWRILHKEMMRQVAKGEVHYPARPLPSTKYVRTNLAQIYAELEANQLAEK